VTGEWPYHLPGNPLRWVLGANPHLPTLQDNRRNSSAAMLVSTVPSDFSEKRVFDTLVPRQSASFDSYGSRVGDLTS